MVSIDILKHEFVPKHVKLSEPETEKLLSSYNISKKQLPKILKGDAAIKDLELNQGDVVKIIRKSATSSESVYYRVVVNA
ncbi:MAG: DNA-directed RNA polymerase subunit H [Nanoarchaeota archaeon]|nr:DNA-directed RNA polymerase subunit H [Nanoarchaeota archaeon]